MSSALDAVEILRQLVAIPTPSKMSNLPLLRFVADFLEPRGWHVELLPYTDDAGVEKANCIARPIARAGVAQDASRVELAFVCHTDTVPYAAEWNEALVLEERSGYLHGCGACDVKGSLACLLAAVVQLSPGEISPSFALILTADEEVGCKGMDRLLGELELRIASAIVSEPTSLRAGIAGKGYGLARITVEGREAHSAFPQQGVSAISIAARLIAEIEDRFAAIAAEAETDALFDPPRTTLNIGVIEGGTAKNIIPGKCSFLVEWRAIPGEEPTLAMDGIQSSIALARTALPQAEIRLERLRAEPGFSPAASGGLQSRLSRLLPGSATGISFGSEASRVARIADEVIVIGPGDMRTAHSERECVPVAELERWTEVLAALIRG